MIEVLEKLSPTTKTGVGVLFTIVVAIFIYRLAAKGLRHLSREARLTQTMAARLHRVARWVVGGSVAMILFQQVGVFHGAWAVLTAMLGAIAIGFVAMWSVLANVVCSILIVVYRPFKIGDRVRILDTAMAGTEGRVVDMNLMYTTLLDESPEAEGAELCVPNNVFFQKTIRRQESPESRMRLSFFQESPADREGAG